MKLKKILLQKGISQSKLARMADMNQCDVNMIINGKKCIHPGWKKRIAAALNMEEQEIFPVYEEAEKK